MTTQEVVDLISYLSTLRRPVSIVGEYHAVGPLNEPSGTRLIDPGARANLQSPVSDGKGHEVSWRRLAASAEGQVDFSLFAAEDSRHAAYALIPVSSPVDQQGRLVIESPAEVLAWFNGKPVAISAGNALKSSPRIAVLDLPRGSSRLLIRLGLTGRADTQARLVTTFVSDQPLGFESDEASPPRGDLPRR